MCILVGILHSHRFFMLFLFIFLESIAPVQFSDYLLVFLPAGLSPLASYHANSLSNQLLEYVLSGLYRFASAHKG